MNEETTKLMLDELHEQTGLLLLQRIRNGEATAAEISAAIKFLKDNGATYDVITSDSPISNLLDSLPFDI
jgi:hypothetical protein